MVGIQWRHSISLGVTCSALTTLGTKHGTRASLENEDIECHRCIPTDCLLSHLKKMNYTCHIYCIMYEVEPNFEDWSKDLFNEIKFSYNIPCHLGVSSRHLIPSRFSEVTSDVVSVFRAYIIIYIIYCTWQPSYHCISSDKLERSVKRTLQVPFWALD